jgi:hypothetical protein
VSPDDNNAWQVLQAAFTLHSLMEKRLDTSLRLLKKAGEWKNIDSLAEHPINPLLLASAMSLSQMREEGYFPNDPSLGPLGSGLLRHYTSCETPAEGLGFAYSLLRLPNFDKQEILDTFLSIEKVYIDGIRLLALIISLPAPLSARMRFFSGDYASLLCRLGAKGLPSKSLISQLWLVESPLRTLGLEDIPPFGKLLVFLNLLGNHLEGHDLQIEHSTERDTQTQNPLINFLDERWEMLGKPPSLRDCDLDRFRVLVNAWAACNPTNFLYTGYGPVEGLTEFGKGLREEPFKLHAMGRLFWNKLRTHGIATNDAIHSTIKHYQTQLNELKTEYNTILKSVISREEKRKLLAPMRLRLLNAERLVKRAFRFYQWNPEELGAHCFSWSMLEPSFIDLGVSREGVKRIFREESERLSYDE